MSQRRAGVPWWSQTLVDRHPVAGVERIGDEVHDTGFPAGAVWNEVRALYRSGLHPAVALHVRHRGHVVLDRTIGHVENPPGGPHGAVATPDTLFSLFSASKIVTAALVHALAEDGLLDLDARVVQYVPAFGRHGKENIRIRHLLSHTAGIPDMPLIADPDALIAQGTVDLDLIHELVPTAPPGLHVAYHPLTVWFLVQEIVERVTGKDIRDALRERILAPLGFEALNYGVPPELAPNVAKHAVTGPAVPSFMTRIFDRSIGVGLDRAIALTNTDAFYENVLPSGNIIATPREVGRFMQLLLQRGILDGVRVMKPHTVDRMVSAATPWAFDGTLTFPMRYGEGVMIGGNRFSLFGLGTRGAYGHLGLSTVVVYADPSRDLAVAFLNTGKPMMAPGMLRWYGALQNIILRTPRVR